MLLEAFSCIIGSMPIEDKESTFKTKAELIHSIINDFMSSIYPKSILVDYKKYKNCYGISKLLNYYSEKQIYHFTM